MSTRLLARSSFVGASSLPADPAARKHEQQGRRWLLVSYFLCPCHVPITLALISAVFGGTVFGAAVTGNAFRLGVVLTTAYAVVLWRGFRQIRRAKEIESQGLSVRCASEGCVVTVPTR